MIPASLLGQIGQVDIPPTGQVLAQAKGAAPVSAQAAVAGYEKLTPEQQQNLQKTGKDLISALGNTDLFHGLSLKIGAGGLDGGGTLGQIVGKFKGVTAYLGTAKAAYDSYQEVQKLEDEIKNVDRKAAEFDASVAEANEELEDNVTRIGATTEIVKGQLINEQNSTKTRIANLDERQGKMEQIAPKLAVGGAVAAIATAGLVALGLSDVDIGDVLGG